MKITLQDLIRKTSDIASLPMVFIRLNQEVNNPLCSIQQIAKIIREDAGLSARLLRIVNSALYQYPSRIDSISTAVTVIGTEQLRDLALATSVMTIFRNVPAELVNMNSFWRHSIGCGVTARVLASHIRESSLERYFLAGILHDLGKLIIFQNCGDEVRQILEKNKITFKQFYEVEREILGFDHSEVGKLLLERWKIPSSLVEMVSCHHAPERSRSFSVGSSIIHLADIITHALQLGGSGDNVVPALEPGAWQRIGMATESLGSILEEVDLQTEDLIKAFL